MCVFVCVCVCVCVCVVLLIENLTGYDYLEEPVCSNLKQLLEQ